MKNPSAFTALLLLPMLAWAQAPDQGTPADAGTAADAGTTTTPPDPARACPPGNLLARKQPTATTGARSPERLTDGIIRGDGTPWNGARSAVFDDGDSSVTYDLGAPTGVTALMVQADNNDSFVLEGSLDGQQWAPLWTVPMHPKPGLQTRLTQGLDATARYLRFGKATGDGFYGIGEVQVFCEQPALWPPPIEAEIAPPGEAKAGEHSRKVRLARNKIGIAALGGLAFLAMMGLGRGWPRARWWMAAGGVGAIGWAAVATWIEHRGSGSGWVWFAGVATIAVIAAFVVCASWRRQGRPWAVSFERATLIAIVIAGGLSWISYGTFHGSRAVHYWDTFHYYVGGKYFRETRYHLLYQCSAIAEVDDGRRKEFEKRQIRDLRNNSLGDAMPHLDRVEECRANFTPERWAALRQDLRLFRAFMGSDWWAKMFKDHGFNASPVWIMAGHPLANFGWDAHLPPPDLVDSPANLVGKNRDEQRAIRTRFAVDKGRFESYIGRIALLDGALYVGLFGLIFWAFGLRACALAVLIWGCGYPWAYFWTGGGFGRVPWLFMSVAGMCLMAKGYRALGGAGITWAMLLRVFPGALIGGVAVKIGWNLVRHRTITRNHQRLILGCTLGLVVLVGASLPVVGGFDAYKEFIGNSMKHTDTPLTNHMGLPTLLSFKWEYRARLTRDNKADDPFIVWKQKRQETLAERRVLHYACLLAFLGLLGFVGRRLDDWEVTALSTLLMVGIFELTCYYYSFVVMLAPLALRRLRYAAALLAMTIAGQIIQLQVGWYDLQYTYETVAVLAAMLFILLDIAWRHWQLDRLGVEVDPDADPPRGPIEEMPPVAALPDVG